MKLKVLEKFVKKEIWKQFKSLKRLKEASVEEIAEVIPLKVAEDLYQILHAEQNLIQSKTKLVA